MFEQFGFDGMVVEMQAKLTLYAQGGIKFLFCASGPLASIHPEASFSPSAHGDCLYSFLCVMWLYRELRLTASLLV